MKLSEISQESPFLESRSKPSKGQQEAGCKKNRFLRFLAVRHVDGGSCSESCVKLDQSTRSYNPKEVTPYLLHLYLFFRLRNE